MQLCMPTFYLITSMKELHFESVLQAQKKENMPGLLSFLLGICSLLEKTYSLLFNNFVEGCRMLWLQDP